MMNYCKTCALRDEEKSICRLTGTIIDIKTDYCSRHVKELTICEVCQQPMLVVGSFVEKDSNEVWHQYCGRCAQLINTCQACPKFQTCPFETDPNPMPKVVTRTVQQGNMVMQVQGRNPERVALLCPTCDCWNDEFGCLKEHGQGCCKKPKFWN